MSLLSKYSRVPGINVILPSRGAFGPEGLEIDVAGTVRTLPMTANDELTFNTPDLLISGRAITMVLESCVPDIPNPGELPLPDVEVLLMAIKCNSVGDKLDVSGSCENCNKEYAYDISIERLFGDMTFIESQNIVELSNGVKILMRPSTWNQHSYHYFHVMKEATAFENSIKNVTDEVTIIKNKEKLHLNIRKLVLSNIINSIIAAITPEGTETNQEAIAYFIQELNKKDFQLIEDKWTEINSKGLPKSIEIICDNCNHSQQHKLEYNPTDFLELT